MWMKKQVKKYNMKGNIIRLEKNRFDPQRQHIIFCPKTPIISKINNTELDIVNNETFTINKFKMIQ